MAITLAKTLDFSRGREKGGHPAADGAGGEPEQASPQYRLPCRAARGRGKGGRPLEPPERPAIDHATRQIPPEQIPRVPLLSAHLCTAPAPGSPYQRHAQGKGRIDSVRTFARGRRAPRKADTQVARSGGRPPGTRQIQPHLREEGGAKGAHPQAGQGVIHRTRYTPGLRPHSQHTFAATLKSPRGVGRTRAHGHRGPSSGSSAHARARRGAALRLETLSYRVGVHRVDVVDVRIRRPQPPPCGAIEVVVRLRWFSPTRNDVKEASPPP